MNLYEVFKRCNDTELYQIARASGLSVLPNATKEQLIHYIIGDEVPTPAPHEFDEWRLAIMGFVIEHRKQLEVQLRCPARTMDPRACFQCVDEQVVSCLVDNKQNLELIQIHKKPIETGGEPMSTNAAATVLNPQNAPRDKEKIKSAGSFQMRRLATALGLMKTTADEMSFGKLTPDERAEVILTALKALDTGGGKPDAAPSAGASAGPAPTADKPGSSVPLVDPEAFKKAQEATGPGVAKRTPKTANGTTGELEGIEGLVASVQALSANVASQLSEMKKGLDELTAIATSLGEFARKGVGLQAQLGAVAESQVQFTKIMLNLMLTVAEERAQAGRLDILTDAVSQVSTLEVMLKEAGAGKAA